MLISDVDLNTRQKRLGRSALFARKWFAFNGPADAPPLPLSYDEREALKIGGLPHIIVWFARSLAMLDYSVLGHPSFDDYARGVMASDHAPDFIKSDEELRRRFPPRPLNGLEPGLYWEPPEADAKTMASYRRSQARGASYTHSEDYLSK